LLYCFFKSSFKSLFTASAKPLSVRAASRQGCDLEEAGCDLEEAGCDLEEAGCDLEEAGCDLEEANRF
jgi:hypothetical protein